MKITFLTLFPKLYEGLIGDSIILRAVKNNKIEIEIVNIRDFSNNNNSKVDDYPYGGGAGMVLMIQPIVEAINKYKRDNSKIYLMTPQGKIFNQQTAKKMSKFEHIILISGHYEGIDNRIANYIDGELSIGDYILTGGELPSMVIADSIIRLLDDVIKKESSLNESFENNLLEHPHYTRPEIFDNHSVPSVLLSGNHKKIDNWRKSESIKITKEKRPDLIKKGE